MPTKWGRIRDSQRQKMYNWEDSLVRKHRSVMHKVLSESEARALIIKIFESHGMRVPDVHIKESRSFVGCFWNYHPKTGRSAIQLSQRGLKLSVVLHECAHGVRYKYTPKDAPEAGHGKTFVRVYMDLLVKYCKLDITELRQTAKEFNLKVAAKPEYDIVIHTRGTIPKVVPAIAAKTEETPKFRKETVQLSVGKLVWTIPTG